MGTHDGAVDHRIFIVRVLGEASEHPLPDTGHRPAAETAMHVLPVTEAFRQVAPRDAGTVTIQHRLDEQAVVRRGRTDGA
jgi:hypothetical protein